MPRPDTPTPTSLSAPGRSVERAVEQLARERVDPVGLVRARREGRRSRACREVAVAELRRDGARELARGRSGAATRLVGHSAQLVVESFALGDVAVEGLFAADRDGRLGDRLDAPRGRSRARGRRSSQPDLAGEQRPLVARPRASPARRSSRSPPASSSRSARGPTPGSLRTSSGRGTRPRVPAGRR